MINRAVMNVPLLSQFIRYQSHPRLELLIAITGDVLFEELSRTHARAFVDHLTAKGNKTGTIRRTMTTLGAIVRSTINELELTETDPFKAIKIQGEGSGELLSMP